MMAAPDLARVMAVRVSKTVWSGETEARRSPVRMISPTVVRRALPSEPPGWN